MATKMSDTAASEVGKVYGKTAYLVTTLAVVPRGTEGAVSVEGTAAGVVASVAMGALAVAMGLIPLSGVPVVAVAAAVATTMESVIGATVQEDVRARGGGCAEGGGGSVAWAGAGDVETGQPTCAPNGGGGDVGGCREEQCAYPRSLTPKVFGMPAADRLQVDANAVLVCLTTAVSRGAPPSRLFSVEVALPRFPTGVSDEPLFPCVAFSSLSASGA